MLIWIIAFVVVIALVIMLFLNRTTGKRNLEDITEIRTSLYEIRTALKSLQADWNYKLSLLQVDFLRANGKIPENRIPYYITKECIACGSCIPECPTQAITENSIFEIHPALCTACGKCADICPVSACQLMGKTD